LAINVDGTCNMAELASFNTASNHLNAPLNISGHLISTGGDLGTYGKQWNNLYLGGNSVHINDAMIEYYREDPRRTKTSQRNLRSQRYWLQGMCCCMGCSRRVTS
jgi:hypothetical protein